VTGLSGPALIAVFVAAAVVTWLAGISLTRSTDALDDRLGLGEALGGLILLSLAGTLPELAITVAAVVQGNLDLAAGNLIGGIAIQTLVLAACDRAVLADHPLSYLVGSLVPVLEGLLVISVVGILLLGVMLPPTLSIGPFSPASIGIVIAWLIGLAIVVRVRRGEPWEVRMPGSRPGRRHVREPMPPVRRKPFQGVSTGRVILAFVAASMVTLVAGVALEMSGDQLARDAGIDGVVFGATFLAAATALPEISSGIAAVRLGDHQLAMSDIFGGNAFQLCLFLLADLLAGKPVLPAAGIANTWLGTLGIVMTVVYVAAVIIRPRRRHLGFGIDSLAAALVFILGIVGLTRIAG